MKLLASALFGVALLASTSVGPPPSPPPPPALMDVPLELASAFVSGGCAVCRCCNGGCVLEEAWMTAEPPPWALEPTMCPDGCAQGCSQGMASADFRDLWEAVRADDVPRIRSILAANGEFVTLNQDRSALQIESCKGLAANFPLKEAIAAQLAE